MTDIDDLPTVMTVAEVAAAFRVSDMTVYRLARSGELPGFRVGGKWRFRRDDIERLFERTTQP